MNLSEKSDVIESHEYSFPSAFYIVFGDLSRWVSVRYESTSIESTVALPLLDFQMLTSNLLKLTSGFTKGFGGLT
jgi:hypothetical protein